MKFNNAGVVNYAKGKTVGGATFYKLNTRKFCKFFFFPFPPDTARITEWQTDRQTD